MPCQGMNFGDDKLLYAWLFLKYEYRLPPNHYFSAASVEIEFQRLEETSGISWSLLQTNCRSSNNLQPTINRVYKTDCVLSVGQTYTLQCEGREDSWWKSNYIVIENSVYCEYAKGNVLIDITVTGKVSF